jgi:hypothetical protein
MRLFFILLFLLIPIGAIALEPQNQESVEKIIEVFSKGQKSKIADLFIYPVIMEYPNPDIYTKKELIKRFDEVFDDNLLRGIAASDASKDWSEVGWRGIMYRGGDVWISYEGKIKKINYITNKQQEKVNKIISVQKENIYIELKTFLRPILEFNMGQFHIRVDQMADFSYRYASWSNGKKTNQSPDIILKNGTVAYDGTGGNHSFNFKNGNYLYRISIFYIGAEDTPPGRLEVFKDEKLILSKDLIAKDKR